jgi:Coenzyme PQQ synthesis protein D (PqqD)
VNGLWLMRSPNALSRSVGSEILLTAPGRDDVVRLAGTAGAVWGLLETPQTLSSLVDALSRSYGAPPEAIAADVQQLLSQLLEEGWAESVADGDD